MQIICCNIPGHTTSTDLYLFAAKGVRSWTTPFVKPHIVCCEIMEIYDEDNSTTEYHGLITYKHEKVAEQAIQKLDGSSINDQHIRVRAFTHRVHGDRRYIEEVITFDVDNDKRTYTNRRRSRIVIKRQRFTPDGNSYLNGIKQ